MSLTELKTAAANILLRAVEAASTLQERERSDIESAVRESGHGCVDGYWKPRFAAERKAAAALAVFEALNDEEGQFDGKAE
jgi:hypothetical protein